MHAETILIVEDEPVVALDLRQTLEEMGHRVCGIQSNMKAAISAVEKYSPTLILMDINLEGQEDGIDACNHIYLRWKLPVIYLTAFADEKTILRAAASKPFGYLLKPYETKELAAVIQVARSRCDTEQALVKSEERLAIAIEAAELGTWEWESLLDHVQGDARFQSIWGSNLSRFSAGMTAMLDRIHPEDREKVDQLLHQDGFFSSIFRARRDSGEFAWLEMHGKLRPGKNGSKQVIGALRDITTRKQMEERLRQASVVFSSTAEGILILDDHYRIVSANPAFTKLTQYTSDEVIHRHPDDFLLVRREGDLTYQSIAESIDGYVYCEVACRCRDGRIFPTLQHICAVKDEAGEVQQFVHIISDISAIRDVELKLAHLAYHDPLTGLGNRYLLEQRLDIELERAHFNGKKIAILFLDLDGFKAINDTMGHNIGDRVIQEVAKRISQHIRRHDEAIRLGGDEFVVVAPELHEISEAFLIAEKLLNALSQKPINIEEQELMIGVSIGIAIYPDDGTNVTQLLSASDSAMYEAKRLGKGQFCTYTSNLIERVRARLNIEQNLHVALEKNEFILHYQPVINLLQNRLIGFEALVRWNHPTLGLIGPDTFISIAEENGLIERLGYWVLDTALAQLKEWELAGHTNLFMAVNVSPRQFNDEHFVHHLGHVLQTHKLRGEQLEVEVTESVIQDFHKSRKIVSAIRDLDITVAIDDFGTGYSSLALLKHLPITRVKIDRSFIVNLPGTSRDLGMVHAIMHMANSLELNVTAEGIETPEQAGLLRELKCPAVQGYFFGRPQEANYFSSDWLRLSAITGHFQW
ncbi:two-component system response regulator [Undibacterium sp. Rencai35W]|uniref:two-component system response regulator n=1 Tax=Undibacterium sp. Rencai35W TaxID=3413046 RepID=UPI003BF1FE7F